MSTEMSVVEAFRALTGVKIHRHILPKTLNPTISDCCFEGIDKQVRSQMENSRARRSSLIENCSRVARR